MICILWCTLLCLCWTALCVNKGSWHMFKESNIFLPLAIFVVHFEPSHCVLILLKWLKCMWNYYCFAKYFSNVVYLKTRIMQTNWQQVTFDSRVSNKFVGPVDIPTTVKANIDIDGCIKSRCNRKQLYRTCCNSLASLMINNCTLYLNNYTSLK